jgi:hypothetical protein
MFNFLITSSKQNIEYVFKEGGIVMTADAVTFELLRLATIQYFEQRTKLLELDVKR